MSEIVEEGVTSIELAASFTWNRIFSPSGHRVKWFRDELGHRWVKFVTDGIDRVWPANRVVEVQYDKSRRGPRPVFAGCTCGAGDNTVVHAVGCEGGPIAR